ncbi:FadR/GntR family transcriptional regulator [Sphaerisporangium aureirubrum]|uniref:FadR/GntR family transcriptional regulator n=1 Tax=Sphaerisporangium aureirubrum TaxID=1544736 RepID=A0ABW1NL09_9ACTN
MSTVGIPGEQVKMVEPRPRTGTRQQRLIQERVKQLIFDRGLRPGEALPTENDLMQELDVSRASLREALKTLEALEIVEVRHGHGMFVGSMSLDALVHGLVFHGLLSQRQDVTAAAELVDVRDILECALVRRVATTIDEDGIARLEQIVERMEELGRQGEPIVPEDRRFHEELYAPLGNRLVIQLLRAFWEVLEVVRPELPGGRRSSPAQDAHHHRLILERLRFRDPMGAELAMREHFAGTHAWLNPATAPAEGA